jgi:hypothetical protein
LFVTKKQEIVIESNSSQESIINNHIHSKTKSVFAMKEGSRMAENHRCIHTLSSLCGSSITNPEAKHHQLPIPSPPTFAPLHETRKPGNVKLRWSDFHALPCPFLNQYHGAWIGVMHQVPKIIFISGRNVAIGAKDAITFSC